MITKYETLAHVKWECKYHIIFAPKYRKKLLYGQIKKRIGEIFRILSREKKVEIIEGHACIDHIHMVLSIPPKYSVAMIIGFLKGKSAIKLHQEFGGRYKNYRGWNFWSRGYCVSTIGLDEEEVKRYVREQENFDKNNEGSQMDMGW